MARFSLIFCGRLLLRANRFRWYQPCFFYSCLFGCSHFWPPHRLLALSQPQHSSLYLLCFVSCSMLTPIPFLSVTWIWCPFRTHVTLLRVLLFVDFLKMDFFFWALERRFGYHYSFICCSLPFFDVALSFFTVTCLFVWFIITLPFFFGRFYLFNFLNKFQSTRILFFPPLLLFFVFLSLILRLKHQKSQDRNLSDV